MANLKRREGAYGAAIDYYRRALTDENSESNAQIQYEIAELHEKMGDIEGACREYLKVEGAYPKGTFWSVRANLKCARAFEKLGRLAEAKRLYEKLAAMDIEESAFARKRLEMMK
jgi:tetratricopeptide (TPR) repeat protein